MPLKSGSSQKTISSNIRELHSGNTFARTSAKFGAKRAQDQSVAIAMSEAGKSKGRAFGGPMMQPPGQVLGGMMGQASNGMMPGGLGQMPSGMPQSPILNGVAGGFPPAPLPPYGGTPNNAVMSNSVAPPFAFGGSAKGIGGHSISRSMTKGPILSAVPGRTDKHFTHVPSGSFVIPADIVSGHGQGNTLAGANNLQSMFKMGPYGMKTQPIGHGRKFKAGGAADDANVGVPVPVKLAGGEIVVPPEHVLETMERIARRKLTLKEAHEIMDKWVITERKKLRRTLAKLPGPAKD